MNEKELKIYILDYSKINQTVKNCNAKMNIIKEILVHVYPKYSSK